MISYEHAYELMMSAAKPLDTECVPLRQALHRVLAQDVVSDSDMPPFHKSAMDGYACRRQDLDQALTVVEEIPAGQFSSRTIGPGECAKIMTGAPVPEGADVVIKVEDIERAAEGRIRFLGRKTSSNICLQGEDIRAGDVVLRAGACLGAAHLAVLAGAGCAEPLVSRRPRVGLIVTGDELVEPSEKLAGGRIRNTNGFQVYAQAEAMHADVHDFGVVPDNAEAIREALLQAKAGRDLVVLTGGVSAGDYDFVPDVLQNSGYSLLFESVAMQPGRPTVFGVEGKTFCCGLPGNPVSAFVVFEILLKPFLYRLQGHAYQPRLAAAVLGQDIRRRNADRQITLPVIFTEPGIVTPLDYHGSAHIHVMAMAHGLLTIPAGAAALSQGTAVQVRLLL